MKIGRSISALSVCLLSLTTLNTFAAAISPGNLVIYRVGDGSAALANTATAVFLDEYTPLGSLVQSIALPTSGGSALSASGTATTEGIISRSQDGSSLIFTGYRKATGGSNPASDTYVTTARIIGTVNAAGTVDLSTTIINDGGATTANTIRSATSVDGTTAFWVSTSTRISYNASPFTSGGTTQIDARNSRQVNLSGNKLFASNGSTAITGKVQDYGILPTGATAANPDVILATGDAVNGFALFDLDAGVAGDDTLYALSTVEGLLRKYSLVGGVWTANGSITTSALNLTGYANGSTANLFLTGTATLYSEVDASGYNATISGSLTTLATAPTNEGFRGIGMFVAVPEPSTCTLAFLGLASLLALRRRRS